MRRLLLALLLSALAWPVQAATLLQTKTAANTASSLAFTGLAGYNILLLNCDGLNIATGAVENLVLQLGEGGTPVWATTYGNYTWTSVLVGDVGSPAGVYDSAAQEQTNNPSNTIPGFMTHHNLVVASNKAQGHLSFALFNAPSSTWYKSIAWQSFGYSADITASYGTNGVGAFIADKNPITAMRLIAAGGGNLTAGTCNLYGSN